MIYYLVNIETKQVWQRFTKRDVAERAESALKQEYPECKFEIFEEWLGETSYAQAAEEQALKKLLK